MAISGEAVRAEGIAETLRIKVDPSSIYESGTMTCLGQTSPLDNVPVLHSGVASALRNCDGYFCDVEIVEGIDSLGVAVTGQGAVPGVEQPAGNGSAIPAVGEGVRDRVSRVGAQTRQGLG